MRLNRLQLFILFQMFFYPVFAQFRVEVPFEDKNGKLIVEVSVNGIGGHFLIDTGAPCCISDSYARKMGVSSIQTVKALDSNGNELDTDVVTLPELKMGNATFTNLQAMKWEKGSLLEQFGVDGIIGYNLMRVKGIVKLSKKTNTFILTDYDKNLQIDYAHCIPMVKAPYLTLIPVRLGSSECDTVMFDSGAKEFYEISMTSYQRLKNNKKALKTLAKGHGILSLGAAGIERNSEKYRSKIPKFSIGKTSFTNVTTLTTDAKDSRLGSSILNYGDVIIDFKDQVFYYLPHEEKEKRDLYAKEWDVLITVMDNYLCAGFVWDHVKTPIPDKARIVAINGKRYGQVDLHEATQKNLVDMPGNKATLTYIDADGKEKTIEIQKR